MAEHFRSVFEHRHPDQHVQQAAHAGRGGHSFQQGRFAAEQQGVDAQAPLDHDALLEECARAGAALPTEQGDGLIRPGQG